MLFGSWESLILLRTRQNNYPEDVDFNDLLFGRGEAHFFWRNGRNCTGLSKSLSRKDCGCQNFSGAFSSPLVLVGQAQPPLQDFFTHFHRGLSIQSPNLYLQLKHNKPLPSGSRVKFTIMAPQQSCKNVPVAAHSESEDGLEPPSQNAVDMLKTAQNLVSAVSTTYPKI